MCWEVYIPSSLWTAAYTNNFSKCQSPVLKAETEKMVDKKKGSWHQSGEIAIGLSESTADLEVGILFEFWKQN